MSQINLQNDIKQYCGFKVGEDTFAISVLNIQEILRDQGLTSIPKAPKVIKGLINLRGQIVTAVSLRLLFGLEESTSNSQMNIIVQHEEDLYSIVVDEVLDVITVDNSTYEPTPDNIDKKIREFISGVHKLDNNLLIVLDFHRVLNLDLT